jgi:ABC-type phosphate transport system substrate-binding protein
MTRTIGRVVIGAALLALLALPALAAAGDFVLVVNPSVKATAVHRSDVARLFLREATEWPGGEHVKPVDQVRTAAVRQEFTQKVLHRSLGEVEAFWTKAIFSGRAVPPPQKKNDGEVLAYVRETPGALGYVDASAQLEGVKPLSIEED